MRQRVTRFLCPFVLAFSALSTGACGTLSSSATPTTPTPPTTTDQFSGTLEQGGAVAHPFTVSTTGPVQISLTSVAPLATMALGVALGTPTASATASPPQP